MNSYHKKLNYSSLGEIFFRIGIFLLPSTISISILFFLLSLFQGLNLNPRKLLDDKYNYPFISCLIALPMITLIQRLDVSFELENFDKRLLWLGLINWLPLFFCFFGFKKYLKSKQQRILIGKILVAGTLPVLISGFGQYFFDWHGPLETLNGLIIWYQRPIGYPNHDGLTGLFSNPNYTGAWLSTVLPISIVITLLNKENFIKNSISLAFVFSFFTSIVLTTSRNAWFGMIITFPIIFKKKGVLLLLSIIIFLLILFYVYRTQILSEDFRNLIQNLLPVDIVKEFTKSNFLGRESRYEIWNNSLNFIAERPLIGWGSNTFHLLYQERVGTFMSHTHNLFLELAYCFGIPISFTITLPILIILKRSYQKYILNPRNINIFDLGWFCSFLICFWLQMNDMTYFDARISLLFWILFCGLRNGLDDNDIVNKKNLLF